jgi:dihydrofolate synthase / folylpolyglutamate synthase
VTTRGPSDPAPARAEDRERYRGTLAALFERRRFGLQPGLEAIRALLGALGHPERRFPAIHVTGSKGKGSVATMAQSILSAHSLRTGRFTSPHLASYRERIQIDGRPIAPREVVDGIDRIDAIARELERSGGIPHPPTFFEVTTALALDWFARRQVAVAVIEVGMGGRLDATNVLDSRVGVITTIELEHTELLGATRSAIAREKSGIFHPGMTGLLGELPPDARATVESEAGRLGVPLWHLGGEVRVEDRTLDADGQTFAVRLPGTRIDAISLPLLGRFQPGNAALALGAVVRFAATTGLAVDSDAVRAGLGRVRWRGRLERIARRPELYYDVAHTPESARAVAQSLAEISPLADPSASAIVFGVLRGKDVAAILDALAPLARTLVVVPVRSARGVPPSELRAAAAGRFPRIVEAPSVESGVRVARAATGTEGFTLVVGSDYLVGELLRAEGGAEDEPDLSDPGIETAPSAPRTRP